LGWECGRWEGIGIGVVGERVGLMSRGGLWSRRGWCRIAGWGGRWVGRGRGVHGGGRAAW